jgi:chromosome segregation ATPase
MAEFEALSHKHITKLSQDNESLSKDLVDTQQVFKQTKERCEQQTDIISDVKDKLGSAEVNLKIVGEENDDLKQEVFKIKENESKLRARLSAMIEEHAAQSCTMQSKLELALEVQERLRREIEFVKKEKNAKDLYVTDVEGKLTSRETSLSDSQKEIAEYQKMSLELQERYERTELRRQAVETELSEAKMQNISLKSRIEALEQSRAAEEAHIKDKWMTALEELELSKRNFAKLEEEKQTLDTELKNAVSYLQRVYAAITARQNVTAKTRSLLTKSMLERADECEQMITISFTHIDELNDCVKELEGSIQREKDKTSRLSQELESARKEIVEQSEAAKKHLASVKVCEVELKALNKVNEEQASKVKSFQASTAILEVQMLETEKCVKQLSNDLSLSLTERKVQEERHTKECGDLRNKIADLQEEFKKLESELEARHMLRKREVEEHESRFSTTLSELDQFRASQSFLEHKQRQADEDSRVSKAEAEQYRREKAMLKSKLEVATQEVIVWAPTRIYIYLGLTGCALERLRGQIFLPESFQ